MCLLATYRIPSSGSPYSPGADGHIAPVPSSHTHLTFSRWCSQQYDHQTLTGKSGKLWLFESHACPKAAGREHQQYCKSPPNDMKVCPTQMASALCAQPITELQTKYGPQKFRGLTTSHEYEDDSTTAIATGKSLALMGWQVWRLFIGRSIFRIQVCLSARTKCAKCWTFSIDHCTCKLGFEVCKLYWSPLTQSYHNTSAPLQDRLLHKPSETNRLAPRACSFAQTEKSRWSEAWLKLPCCNMVTPTPYGCVWKCCVPHCTQWFCWSLSHIIPFLNGYFIGNIPILTQHFQLPTHTTIPCHQYFRQLPVPVFIGPRPAPWQTMPRCQHFPWHPRRFNEGKKYGR